MKTVTLVLTLKVPDGVSQAQTQDYVRTAVRSWNGGIDPEEELFGAFRGRGDLKVEPLVSALKPIHAAYLATVETDVDEWYTTRDQIHGTGLNGFREWLKERK